MSGRVRTTIIVVLLFGLSVGLWAHFTRQALDAEEAAAQAKAEEEWNKRYPVKGRRTDLKEPSPVTTSGAPPLDSVTPNSNKEKERPRIRISRGEDE